MTDSELIGSFNPALIKWGVVVAVPNMSSNL